MGFVGRWGWEIGDWGWAWRGRTASPRWVLRVHVVWTVYSVVTSAASAERGRRRAARLREVGRRIVLGIW